MIIRDRITYYDFVNPPLEIIVSVSDFKCCKLLSSNTFRVFRKTKDFEQFLKYLTNFKDQKVILQTYDGELRRTTLEFFLFNYEVCLRNSKGGWE